MRHALCKRGAMTFVTMTLARSEDEAALLERSLRRLASDGRAVVVTDGGSGEAFVARLRSIPSVQLCEAHGLVRQMKTSIAAALRRETSLLFYSEPAKYGFFDTELDRVIARAEALDGNSVVVASRSPPSAQPFPPHQQRTENEINRLCGRMFQVEGDFSY